MIPDYLDDIHEQALWIRHDYLVELLKDAVDELTEIKGQLDVGRYA